jgi:hypothetical protein
MNLENMIKNKEIPIDEKKKVLVLYDSKDARNLISFSQYKLELLKRFQEDSIRIFNKEKLSLELDKMIYHFFDVSKRNVSSFMKKYINVDVIYVTFFYKVGDYHQMGQVLPLVNFDKNKIKDCYNSNTLFIEYTSLYPKVEVYILNRFLTGIEKIEILEYEFNFQKQYRTKEEAIEQLKKEVENKIASIIMSISSYEKDLEVNKKLLNKLNKVKD